RTASRGLLQKVPLIAIGEASRTAPSDPRTRVAIGKTYWQLMPQRSPTTRKSPPRASTSAGPKPGLMTRTGAGSMGVPLAWTRRATTPLGLFHTTRYSEPFQATAG